MASTFLRGLALIEIVGLEGPLGVTELAKRLGTDKSSVSRMIAAAAADGWLTRTDSGVTLGPRLPVLAHHTDLAGRLRDAQPALDAVAGVTGLFTQACVVVGHTAIPVLSGGRPPVGVPRPPGLQMPIWSVAAGRAAATLVPSAELATRLPDDPLPAMEVSDAVRRELTTFGGAATGDDSTRSWPRSTREQFLNAVDDARQAGVTVDNGEFHPQIQCIAVPWGELTEPASLCVIGTPSDVEAGADLAEAVLREAAKPGATRDRVVRSAARFHDT